MDIPEPGDGHVEQVHRIKRGPRRVARTDLVVPVDGGDIDDGPGFGTAQGMIQPTGDGNSP
jgi:hypothetical protein